MSIVVPLFTPERAQLVRDFYGKIHTDELVRQINALDGPRVTRLSLKRFLERERAKVAHGIERAPIIAGYWRVSAWAHENGVEFTCWDDLPAVNDRAFRLKHPGFARELPVHRAARLRRVA